MAGQDTIHTRSLPDTIGREGKNNKAEGDDGSIDTSDGACRDAVSWDLACLRAIANGQRQNKLFTHAASCWM